jgi:uncharacterized membrane protein
LLEFNPGNHNKGDTPVPIPNTEVKPFSADGTAPGAEWESRSLPGFFYEEVGEQSPLTQKKENICPYCGSVEISPAEREYTTDYPFWVVIGVVFLLIGILLLLFFLLQLHPVILILILVAVVSKLLDTRSRSRRKSQKVEFICLKCDQRFLGSKPLSRDEKE